MPTHAIAPYCEGENSAVIQGPHGARIGDGSTYRLVRDGTASFPHMCVKRLSSRGGSAWERRRRQQHQQPHQKRRFFARRHDHLPAGVAHTQRRAGRGGERTEKTPTTRKRGKGRTYLKTTTSVASRFPFRPTSPPFSFAPSAARAATP